MFIWCIILKYKHYAYAFVYIFTIFEYTFIYTLFTLKRYALYILIF